MKGPRAPRQAGARREPRLLLSSATRRDRHFARGHRRRSGQSEGAYYLGNLFYDRQRYDEALACWRTSAGLDPTFSIVWRNLGIGAFNVRKDSAEAMNCYERAFAAAPGDARVLYERDQLWKRIGRMPADRLAELRKHRSLVDHRDDLSVEFCALLNQVGAHDEALEVLTRRRFQPWEGGEGMALHQYVRTRLALGRRELAAGRAAEARRHFEAAIGAPETLGEAKHLLANQSDVHYWLGCACAAEKDEPPRGVTGGWQANSAATSKACASASIRK